MYIHMCCVPYTHHIHMCILAMPPHTPTHLVNELECSDEASVCDSELVQLLCQSFLQLGCSVEGYLFPFLLLTVMHSQLPQQVFHLHVDVGDVPGNQCGLRRQLGRARATGNLWRGGGAGILISLNVRHRSDPHSHRSNPHTPHTHDA